VDHTTFEQGNDKGTLSDEQGRKPANTTREQARRINSLVFGVVTAGSRFKSWAAHHSVVNAVLTMIFSCAFGSILQLENIGEQKLHHSRHGTLV
jgi:hypothetical protein